MWARSARSHREAASVDGGFGPLNGAAAPPRMYEAAFRTLDED
jgi:hypothetical protein